VYPSAYANAYASKICAGKIKDPSGVKRKDFKGRKPAAEGGPMNKDEKKRKLMGTGKSNPGPKIIELIKKRGASKKEALDKLKKELGMRAGGLAPVVPKTVKKLKNIMGAANRDRGKEKARVKKMGGARRPAMKGPLGRLATEKPRKGMMGGGLMEATERLRRQGLKRGGRGCKLAMKGRGRAYGKNS
jgi:hypothetical protein